MASKTDNDLIWGFRPVTDALEADPEGAISLLIASNRKRGVDGLLKAARRARIPIDTVEESDLAGRCAKGANHQGVLLEVEPFAYGDFDQLLGDLEGEGAATVLVLDQIQDPQNLGAILRSAGGFGVDAVLVPDRRACPVTSAAIRASAGVARRVRVVQVSNLTRALEALKAIGFWAAAAVARDGQSPASANLTGKTVIVMGSEGKGIRPLVERTCDLRLTLPLAKGVESLNVSAATAALLYEVVRQKSA